MYADPRQARLGILLRQGRLDDARREVMQLLGENPADVSNLALLAEIQLRQADLASAEETVNRAMGLSPEHTGLFFLKSQIKLQQQDYPAAEQLLREATVIDPLDPDIQAMLAQTLLLQKEFTGALGAADQALSLEPQNLLALNMRSKALIKLDRREESYATIEGALREDPDNAYTHANYGWGLLETGEYGKAKEHFAQSLRADPTDDYARSGMAEAVKARNPLYRMFLKYAFFMQNLTQRYQWGVIIGIYVLYRIINGVARSNPDLQPFLYPLLGVLTVVAISTWVIEPIGNLFLRFDRHARFLLDEGEFRTANLAAACLAATAAGLLGYLVSGHDGFLVLAGYGFTMLLPVGQAYARVKRPWLIRGYGIGLALVGLVAVVFAFAAEPFNLFTVIYLLGLFAFQWVANFQLIRY